jgi:hypothetical protein
VTVVYCGANQSAAVMCSDSRSTATDAAGFQRMTTDNAEKLFIVGSCLVGTTGEASLGEFTIADHLRRFAPRGTQPGEVAQELAELVFPLYEQGFGLRRGAPAPDPRRTLRFVVAGLESTGHPCVVYVDAERRAVEEKWRGAGFAWEGEERHINRLLLGRERPELPPLPPEVEALLRPPDLRNLLEGFERQDLIDFGVFLIETTMKMQRFSWGPVEGQPGVVTVGGPIDVAIVDADGPRFIRRKQLTAEPRVTQRL